MVTGTWSDGRVATIRGNRGSPASYGFVGFAEKGAKAVSVTTSVIYRELLKKVIAMFTNGKPPIPRQETLELVAFIEAANRSGDNHGAIEMIKV